MNCIFDELLLRYYSFLNLPSYSFSLSTDLNLLTDIDTLKNIKTISLWGEGVAGKVHLEIESIKAIGCSSTNALAREARGNSSEGPSNGDSSVWTASMVLVVLAAVAVFSVFVIRKRTDRKAYSGLNDHAGTTTSTSSSIV